MLVPGVRTHDALRLVAESIRLTVRDERLATRRGALAITISCGGVLSSGGGDTEELVHAADAAMYRAKQSGRDRTLLAGDSGLMIPRDEPELLLIAQSFAHTASIREGVPELHCAQVADLAGRIATHLGLPAATVLRCRLARLAARRRQDRDPRPRTRQAGPADRRRVACDDHARRVRRRPRRAHARHRRERRRRPPPPRALGRRRLSRSP